MKWILIVLAALFASPAAAHDHAMSMAKPLIATSVYNLDSIWQDEDGKATPLSALRGQPVILAMAYTSCKDMCPLIVADMIWIEDQANKRGLTKNTFAFFSFDTDIDTPEKLKAYALEHGLDPKRWSLFHGDKSAVRELAAVLGIRYKRDASGNFDHSNVITLLDAEGAISYQQVGSEAHSIDFVKKLEALGRK